MKSLLGEITGNTGTGQVKMHHAALFDMRFAREDALAKASTSQEEYDAVREVWRAMLKEETPANAALASAMEARRPELDAVSLGDYELVDVF